jgi:hypothetical protein
MSFSIRWRKIEFQKISLKLFLLLKGDSWKNKGLNVFFYLFIYLLNSPCCWLKNVCAGQSGEILLWKKLTFLGKKFLFFWKIVIFKNPAIFKKKKCPMKTNVNEKKTRLKK